MSTADRGVSTTARRPERSRPTYLGLTFDEIPFPAGALLLNRALDLVDQATDHSLAAIRARGVGPDEDQVASTDEIPY